MIDLHSHVLPGLDDGAADLEEALAICRAAAADGIELLAATPHVRHDHPTTPEQMEAALAAVQAAAGGTVGLLPGGELDLAELDRPVDELRRFALAGNPAFLLVETPYHGWPLDIATAVHPARRRRHHSGAGAPGAQPGGAAAAGAAGRARRERARSCR